MFQFWIGRELGCEAQASRIGETDSGHFNAVGRKLCMLADLGSVREVEGNEGGRFRMWCCLKRAPALCRRTILGPKGEKHALDEVSCSRWTP